MRTINKKKIADEIWVKFPEDEEIQLKIRQFPTSQGMYIPGISDETMFEFAWKKFNYCIVDWKGFIDENEKPLECNEENKRYVYDYIEDIMMWASNEISKLKEDIVTTQKKTS